MWLCVLTLKAIWQQIIAEWVQVAWGLAVCVCVCVCVRARARYRIPLSLAIFL